MKFLCVVRAETGSTFPTCELPQPARQPVTKEFPHGLQLLTVASHLRGYIAKISLHGGGIFWHWLFTRNPDVLIASRLGIITTRRAFHLLTTTRKRISRAAPKCFPSQAEIPRCRALLKTANSKDPVGATRRAVERSTMINGREPLTNQESGLLPSNNQYLSF